jgi:hypothetical protein
LYDERRRLTGIDPGDEGANAIALDQQKYRREPAAISGGN